MSREGDRSSFYAYGQPKLADSTNDSQRENATALMETLRLKKENDDLWLCLKLMRDNSELQCANLISAVIAWSDDKFKRRFLELNSALTRHHLESRSPFRPISPATASHLDTKSSSVTPRHVIGTSPQRSVTPLSRSPSPVYHRITNAPSPTQGSVYDEGGEKTSVQVYRRRTSILEVESRKTSNSGSSRASSPFMPLSPTQGSVYEGLTYSPSPNLSKNVSLLKNSLSQAFTPTLESETEISHVINKVQDDRPMSMPLGYHMANPVSQSYAGFGRAFPTKPIFNVNEQINGFTVNERRVSPTSPYSRSPSSFDGPEYDGGNEHLSQGRFSPDPPASPQPQVSLTTQQKRHHLPEHNSPFYRPISSSDIKQNEQRFSSNVRSHSLVIENNRVSPKDRSSPNIKEVNNSIGLSTYSSGFFQDSGSYSRYPSTLDSNALVSSVDNYVRPTPVFDQRNTFSTSPRFGQSHSPYQQSVSPKPMSLKDLEFGPSRKSPVPEHFSRNNEGRVPTPFPGDFVVTDYDTSIRSETGASSVGQPIAFSTPVKRPSHSISPIQEMFEEERRVKSASQAHYTSSRPSSSNSSVIKPNTFKPSHRLLGEITFQLERRILDFIFSKRQKGQKERLHRRFYGYTVSNIPVMITREATNRDGSLDHAKRCMYEQRYDQIMKSLSAFGYILEKHSFFCLKMINKYGLLSQPPDRQTMEISGLQNPATLRMYVNDLAQNEKETTHMMVVLECLLLLAHDDGQSVFLW